MHDLEDDMLLDIGVRRSEIGSIEAESRAGWGQATRLRIVARPGCTDGRSLVAHVFDAGVEVVR